MKLMTKAMEKQMPALYEQDGLGDKAMVYAHFFTGDKDWYAMEFDPESRDFFGWVKFYGNPGELGYFNLDEMERMAEPRITAVGGRICVQMLERDKYFEPCMLGAVKKHHESL